MMNTNEREYVAGLTRTFEEKTGLEFRGIICGEADPYPAARFRGAIFGAVMAYGISIFTPAQGPLWPFVGAINILSQARPKMLWD